MGMMNSVKGDIEDEFKRATQKGCGESSAKARGGNYTRTNGRAAIISRSLLGLQPSPFSSLSWTVTSTVSIIFNPTNGGALETKGLVTLCSPLFVHFL